jgi:hypothetical protein
VRFTNAKLRVAAAVLTLGAAAPVAAAGLDRVQTTEPTNFVIFTVKLASTGVAFTPLPVAKSETTGEFRIYNQSGKSRRFELAGRESRLLKPKAHTIFFLLLADPGMYTWRSVGPKAHAFKGTFQVTD